jgi:hypothetical protein
VITRDPKDHEHFLSRLMSCGVIIYDITKDANQISEACHVLKGPLIQIYTHMYIYACMYIHAPLIEKGMILRE